ncbi:LysR family transcriptional regulator [Paenibacillus sp. CAA11]|uniref:LysR family transcriptional regulator n=1 Tax=Paenibacillus sp. CAA11 TaxID=1532905 RepID=UPI000D36DEF3|nr:LysR family transcriptional regulator [Paenibacillus sp. CAA11]AWB46495.1 LysR family transcriptional regulator [Paenibacillus sp. CAA11]
MDLRAIRTFQRIVETGSFMRAADDLNYAQSTVTMQIQKLESELGAVLLERGKQQLRLTEAGRLFYTQSLQIAKEVTKLTQSIQELQTGISGDIRLGVTEPTGSYRLPPVLSRFLADFPGVRVSLEFASSKVLAQRVEAGELDLALCSAPDLGTSLHFEILFREEFAVLLPSGHPLGDQPVIHPVDLSTERLLITAGHCPYRRKLEMVMQETEHAGLNTMEIGSMTALKHYVEHGLGIALVPRILLDPLPAGTLTRPLSGSLVDMAFGLLTQTREAMNPACTRLYQHLKQELQQKPE